MVLLPAVGLIGMWFIDPLVTLPADPTDVSPAAQFAIFTDPAIVINSLLGFVTAALVVVAAFLDYRQLRAIGVVRPFHWAWAFAVFLVSSLVYVIGRTVIVRSVSGGRGMAPLWAAIALTVVGMVSTTVWVVLFFNALIEWTFATGGMPS
ncbi:MAG: hypothetical protein K0S37_1857 [Microbacterium sp.]|nr:hypothetical protein [Microbacterium sp.]